MSNLRLPPSNHSRVPFRTLGLRTRRLLPTICSTPGRGGWFVETKSGDDYTRDLSAWGERHCERLTVNKTFIAR